MRIVKILDRIERIAIVILFSIMVLAVFSQVVNRNLLKLEITWFEEAARICMVYMLMFATEIGLRDHSQLNVDSLVRRLPEAAAKVCSQIVTIITIVFSGVVGVSSITLLKTKAASGAVTPSLGLPAAIPPAGVTIGCIFICITQIIAFVNTLCKSREKKGEEKE